MPAVCVRHLPREDPDTTCLFMYKHLDWDTEFFGFKTAVISNIHDSPDALSNTLQELQDQDYRLVYLFTDPAHTLVNKTAARLGGLLVDEKVTFLMQNPAEVQCKPVPEIEVYPEVIPDQDLIQLAIVSGEYSRFRLDSNFPEGKFEELYTRWITNSTLRQNAEEVYVYRSEGKIKGIITAGRKENAGLIGLIAVDASCQGSGIGKKLICRVKTFCREKQLAELNVVTQIANKPACRFYEKMGFRIKDIKNIYHFWLEE